MADMEFALAFTGDTSDLKAASAEAKQAVSSVSDEASKSATDVNAHAAALEKEASAARKAADANTANANATRKAREEAARAAGAVPSSSPPVGAPSHAPVAPRPASPSVPQPQRPLQPPQQPDNDNQHADRNRRQVLSYQLFDIGQTAASGMPLSMIAAQQGPQIAQLYAGEGGATKALEDFKVIGSGVSKLFTPLTVGVGAVAAAAAVGVSAYANYLSSIKEVQTAASGFGRAVAGTASEMEAAAEAGAAAAGISVTAARSMQAQFLQSGKIGSEHYEGLIALSKDFAATVGMDADAAGAALTEMFSDPAKAAQTLNRQYGLLDAATNRRITDLAAQNRVSEAQGVLLDALPEKLAKAEKATTALGRAWQAVTTGASNAGDAIGRAIDWAISGNAGDDRIRQLENILSRSIGVRDRSKLEAELAALKSQKDAAATGQEEASRNQREAVATGIAENSGANSTAMRRRSLENSIATLRSGLNPQSDDVAGQQMITAAIEAQERVLEALIHAKERNAELDRLDIQITNEKNPIQRAELEARRTRLQMAEQEVSADKVAEEAQRARNRVIAETVAAAGSQLSDMRDELEVRQRLAAQVAAGTITQADANRMLSEELTLRPLVAAAASAEAGDKEKLQVAISGLREAYAGLAAIQREEAAQSIIKSQSEKLEQLRVELALVGQSDEVRRRSLALLQAEQQIRSEGIASDSQRAEQIRSAATAIADQTAEVERLRDAWGEVQSAIEGAVNSGVDKLAEGDWSGALDAVKKEIVGGLTQIGIKNPLANALDGGNRGTISDVGGLGGIVGRLFGGEAKTPQSIVSGAMQSVASMSVNAASVVINGGVGGDVSRLFSPANGNSAVGDAFKAAGITKTGIPLSEVVSENGLKANVASAYAPRFQGLLNDLKAAGYNITSLGEGGYSYRNVAGTNNLSKHSFGEAIDINPRQNPWSSVLKTDLPPNVNDIARRNGMTWGGTWNKPDTMHFQVDKSISDAALGLGKVSTAATSAATSATGLTTGMQGATQGLGVLGTSFEKFGSAVGGMFGGAPGASVGGGFGSWLGGLFSPSASSLNASIGFTGANTTLGAFLTGKAEGGYSGPGGKYEPRGIYHAGEVIFSQADVSRLGGVGNVEAIRTGRRSLGNRWSGGPADIMPLPSAALGSGAGQSSGGNVAINIQNYSGQEIRQEETTDSRGNKQVTMVIGQQQAAAIKQRGNPARRAFQDEFNVRTRGISR